MKEITVVIHGIYTGHESISNFPILSPYRFYLNKKLCKFLTKYKLNYLFFTIGTRESISAIAIMHPFDEFNPDIGETIVKGRIKRMLGEIEGRLPYDPRPEYIFNMDEVSRKSVVRELDVNWEDRE